MATDTVTGRHLAAGNTKQIKTGPGWSVWSLCGAADVERQRGAKGEAGVFHLLENQTESHWFSHDIPNPPEHTPSESDGWRGERAHHLTYKHAPQTQSPTPHLGPATTPSSPISPWPSLSPLSPSHLCLCGAAAAQRTEGAAFTSEHISHQMSPFAASPSNIQADNAPCILNIWLTTAPTKGAGWRSGLQQPRLVELKATSTVTPRACPHNLVVESYSRGINIKGCLEIHKLARDEISPQNGYQLDFTTENRYFFIFTQLFMQTCAKNFECLPVFLYPKYVWAAQRSDSRGEMLTDNLDVTSDSCNRSAAVTLRVSSLRSDLETAARHTLHYRHKDIRRRPSRMSHSET